MSRIGRKLIKLSENVTVEVKDGLVIVKGPKGELTKPIGQGFTLKIEDNVLEVINHSKDKDGRAKHGLYRSLISNMVTGVIEGFKKDLEIIGVGYRVQLEGGKLVFSLGYSHPVVVEPVENITFEVEAQNKLSVYGIDKELVGQVAANIKGFRPPCSYKGKGIRFSGEYVRKKQGKTVKK
ncbi:50S ribosomal protein L6 [Candidatus Margulisiibacteriota bacterium]